MAVGISAGELRTSTEDELVTKLREAKEELFNLRFQAATGQLESHGRLRGVRREIARIYTVMRERELGIIVDVEEAEEEPAPAADEAAPRRRARQAAPAAAADEAGSEEAGSDEAGSEQAAADQGGTDEAGADEAAGAAVAEEPDGDE